MLRQIFLTAMAILLPYLLYAIADFLRQRRRDPSVIDAQPGFWTRAPVFALGMVGCLLAVIILVALAVYDTSSLSPRYTPPIVQD